MAEEQRVGEALPDGASVPVSPPAEAQVITGAGPGSWSADTVRRWTGGGTPVITHGSDTHCYSEDDRDDDTMCHLCQHFRQPQLQSRWQWWWHQPVNTHGSDCYSEDDTIVSYVSSLQTLADMSWKCHQYQEWHPVMWSLTGRDIWWYAFVDIVVTWGVAKKMVTSTEMSVVMNW